jgi:hypothetical protein
MGTMSATAQHRRATPTCPIARDAMSFKFSGHFNAYTGTFQGPDSRPYPVWCAFLEGEPKATIAVDDDLIKLVTLALSAPTIGGTRRISSKARLRRLLGSADRTPGRIDDRHLARAEGTADSRPQTHRRRALAPAVAADGSAAVHATSWQQPAHRPATSESSHYPTAARSTTCCRTAEAASNSSPIARETTRATLSSSQLDTSRSNRCRCGHDSAGWTSLRGYRHA